MYTIAEYKDNVEVARSERSMSFDEANTVLKRIKAVTNSDFRVVEIGS